MTDDPKARLAATLTANGPEAALGALECALAWAAQELPGTDASDPETVFDTVVALDRALVQVDGVVAVARALLPSAPTGPKVQQRLVERLAELDRLRHEVAAARVELERHLSSEAELRDLTADHSRVTGELAELARLEQLADELPAIREQHTALEKRLGESAEQAAGVEHDLQETAGGLLLLSEERYALLAPGVAQTLAEATAAQDRLATARRELAAYTGELTAAVKGFEELRGLRDARLEALRIYRRLDQELIDGLVTADGTEADEVVDKDTEPAGLERAKAAMAEIEQRLTEVDAVLTSVLNDHTRTYEKAHRALGWSDRA
jgi:uncharacterized membrane-anchored protein YhcB (DUF1043 family)